MVDVSDIFKYVPNNSFTISSLSDAATDLMWTAKVPVPSDSTGFPSSSMLSVRNVTNLLNIIPGVSSLTSLAQETKLQIKILQAELIQPEIKTMNVPAGTQTIPIPTGTDIGNLTLEFYEDQFYTARECATKWLNKVISLTGNVGLPANNKTFLKSAINFLTNANLNNVNGFVDEIEIHCLHDSGLDMLCNRITCFPIKIYKNTLKRAGETSIITTKVEYAVLKSEMLAGLGNAGGAISAGLDVFRAIKSNKK